MSLAENRAITLRMFELVNAGQFEALGEVVDTNFLDHGPGQGGGLAGLQRGLHMMHAALPNLHFGVDQVIAEGDVVAIRGNLTATFTGGPFWGVPATGKSAKWLSFMVMKLSGGKIVERWVNADTWGMLQQVGVLPQTPMDVKPLLQDGPVALNIVTDAGGELVESNKRLTQELIDRVWNKRDVGAVDELFAPKGGCANGDFVLRPDVIKMFGGMVFAAFPDFSATVEFMRGEGNTVIARVDEGGMHTGEFMGVPATQKTVRWSETFCLVFEDGKITRAWLQPDTMGMMQKMSAFHPLVPADAAKNG